jgi:nitrate reductase NapE component
MLAGLVGLTLGCYLSQKLKPRYPKVDPIICGVGLFISAPLLLGTTFAVTYNIALCYVLLFLGQVALNLNWSIVSDILLYIVLPTRRSTAEGFQLLVSHALGDAGSPYLIGCMSDAILILLNKSSDSEWNEFKALQYALFTTCFVEIVGAFFFLVNALYILEDKHKVDKAIQGNSQQLLADSLETESPS